MWWLSLGLFLVCIIERHNLDNPNIQGWFNIFTISEHSVLHISCPHSILPYSF
ncbi:hypothetical protein EDD17DRAFT_1619196 [Pisolithus thermaeus]|nr:hypothetical protein EDD17DRAFT_1619196 [Pisolithus thermaeus]